MKKILVIMLITATSLVAAILPAKEYETETETEEEIMVDGEVDSETVPKTFDDED